MSDSRRKVAAHAVRILAVLIFGWGILLLLSPQAATNRGGAGFVFLVLGPLVMLTARWVEPGKTPPTEPTSETDEPTSKTDGEEANDEPGT